MLKAKDSYMAFPAKATQNADPNPYRLNAEDHRTKQSKRKVGQKKERNRILTRNQRNGEKWNNEGTKR